MYRLNVNITEETAAILKQEAKRYGTTMGTIITIWALEKKTQLEAFEAIAMQKSENEKSCATV